MRAAARSPHPALLSQPRKRREGGRCPKLSRASPPIRRASPGRQDLVCDPRASRASVSRVHLPVYRVCPLHPSSYLGAPSLAQVAQEPLPSSTPCRGEGGCGGRGGAGCRAGRGLRRREEAGSVPDGAAASEPGRSGEAAAGQEPGSAAAAPGSGTHVELPRGAREQ